ncbi:hypothetical protein F5884DRAFT_802022 [Xylogone sp. PMI_703]|nr:hypothetical protein F5884DRAFT_802022 [Xylogone sp. PMI_703]
MARPVWQSRTCKTCRKRKVKCDKTQPRCGNCVESGRTCEGTYGAGDLQYISHSGDQSREMRQLNFAGRSLTSAYDRMTLIYGPSPRFQYRVKLLSDFLSVYLPDTSVECVPKHTNAFSWFEHLPDFFGQCIILDAAVVALSLGIVGRLKEDDNFKNLGERYYTTTLKKICSINALGTLSVQNNLIGTAVILATYELYVGLPGRWTLHVHATCNLLKERGPPTPENPFDESLFCQIRTFAFFNACANHQRTFLSRPEWILTTTDKDAHDKLLDILFNLPSILELSDRIKVSTDVHETNQIVCQILQHSSVMKKQLLYWFWKFQTLKGPLFLIEAPTPESLLFGDPDLDMGRHFSEVLRFLDAHVWSTILLYWQGSLMLYTFLADMKQLLNVVNRPDVNLTNIFELFDTNGTIAGGYFPETLFSQSGFEASGDAERAASYFATRLCQSMTYCGFNKVRGFLLQVAMTSLWTAQHYFNHRSPAKHAWCQRVLDALQKKGIAYASISFAHFL